MKATTGRKIGMATIIMMASITLSRVIGIVREAAIANIGGAGTDVDAYKFAFVLPEILNHILASGFLSVTFIPMFSRYLADDNEAEGWRVFSIILTIFGCLLAILVCGCVILAPHLVPLMVSDQKAPEFIAMSVRMTRIVLPAQLFFFAGGLFMAVQFAKEHFFLPALAPLVYNLGIITGGYFLGPQLGMEGFAWGALGGAFLGNCLLQVFGARRVGLCYSPLMDFKHPDLLRYIMLAIPLMIGLTMVFSTEIFSKIFGSFLPTGAISYVDFAWKIVMMVVAFFGQAIGVASFPQLAQLAARRQYAEMNRLFNGVLRYISLVIPASVLVWILRHEIVGLIFERGKFSAEDTQMTALALSGMLVGAVAFSAQTVVNRGFYAMQNNWTPAIYGSLAVVLSLPLYWLGITTMGVFGLGLAIALSALIQVNFLYAVWSHRTGNKDQLAIYSFFLKIVLITLPIGLTLSLIHSFILRYLDTTLLLGRLGSIVTITGLFIGLVVIAAWRLDIKEVSLVWSRLIQRVLNR
jgi:putative peptidoglycan lipid II flippase